MRKLEMKKKVPILRILLFAIGCGYLARLGILHKQAEYRVAHALNTPALTPAEQAVVMALVKHQTRFSANSLDGFADGDTSSLQEVQRYLPLTPGPEDGLIRKYAAEYELILPHMQNRESPTVLEYLNGIKNEIVELTGGSKPVLHFILGNVIFLLVVAVVILFDGTTRTALKVGLLATIVLAVGNEMVDLAEALINHKVISPVGILEDVVLSLIGPVCITVVVHRINKGTSRTGR